MHSLLGHASPLCRTALSPWLGRAAKSNTCKDTEFAKIPFWGARMDICCICCLCAGRVQAQSAPETEAAFFSFSFFFSVLLSCFVFGGAGLNCKSECKPCCFSIFPFSLKRAVLLSAFRMSEKQSDWWKWDFSQNCCPEKKAKEWEMALREKKKKNCFIAGHEILPDFFNVFLIKELINILTCLVIVSINWWRLKVPMKRSRERKQNVLASCGKKLFKNMGQVHYPSPLRILLD